MKKTEILKKYIIYSVLILLIGVINIKINVVEIPDRSLLSDRHIDFITISTVFAGFSFTTLGLLLGLSSEKLIELLKDTDIMMNKVNRIIESIVFFISSVTMSIIQITGIGYNIAKNDQLSILVEKIIYILALGYLIYGIYLFAYSVYELYGLLRRIYNCNSKQAQEKIEALRNNLQRIEEKEKNIKLDD